MQLLDKRGFVVAAFALLVVFWGSAFPVIKVGLEYSPPMIFAGLRTLLGGLAMTLAALALRENLRLRHNWPVFSAAGRF